MSRHTSPVALRRLALGVVIAVLLLVAWKLPLLKSVTGLAVLEPTAVWFITQDGNSMIKTGWESNLLGSGGEQTMIEFDGSDVIRLEINPTLFDGSLVVKGDTIATILSLATESAIEELQADLEILQASQAALREGSRPVDIDIAMREVEFANASLEALRPEYERTKELHDKGLVSLEELQKVEGEYKTLKATSQLAESNLEAVKMGARPVDIEIAAREIDRLEKLLGQAHRRHELRNVLLTPVPGIFRIGDALGYIAKVVRTDTLAACISLQESMLSDIRTDSNIDVTLAVDGRQVSGPFNRIIYRKTANSGSTVVGLIDNRDGSLKPGMHGHGVIATTPRSLLSSVTRTLRTKSR